MSYLKNIKPMAFILKKCSTLLQVLNFYSFVRFLNIKPYIYDFKLRHQVFVHFVNLQQTNFINPLRITSCLKIMTVFDTNTLKVHLKMLDRFHLCTY